MIFMNIRLYAAKSVVCCSRDWRFTFNIPITILNAKLYTKVPLLILDICDQDMYVYNVSYLTPNCVV